MNVVIEIDGVRHRLVVDDDPSCLNCSLYGRCKGIANICDYLFDELNDKIYAHFEIEK